ncbi:GNAT family N-acetyltransferase [Streptomyces silvensis]|uniref:Acetyltransferase n=1 Tax=Streptomyces silvensis TaxID=1765722 RepID=A0A0W7XBM9_9ACTN|nr:GNAT family N-acetyltransferase [Streptomyces silvensis]KUF19986.1 acetyltransferase [Streptomyces silvensis]
MDLKHYGPEDAKDIRALLLDIHDDAYAEEHDEFHSRERFAQFVDAWSAKQTWACVIGFDKGDPVGYVYGAAFSPGGWWRGVQDPEWLTPETRVFAVSELMVDPRWRKTGAARALHNALVGTQNADYATLFVDTAHPRVIALYERWGYDKLSESKPFDDAPLYAVMAKQLSEPS